MDFSRGVICSCWRVSFWCCKELQFIQVPVDNLRFAAADRSLDNILWADALRVPWDHWNSVRFLNVYSRELLIERSMRTVFALVFLGCHICEIFVVPLARRCELCLSISALWSGECEPTWSLVVPKQLFFSYSWPLLIKHPTVDFLWNVFIKEHCVRTFCSFLNNSWFGAPAGFSHVPCMQLAEYSGLGVICFLHSWMRRFVKLYEIFRLLECTTVKPIVGYLAVSQSLTLDWDVTESAGCCTYSWDTNFVHPLDEHDTTIRDHDKPFKRFLPGISAVSLNGLWIMSLEGAFRALRVNYGEVIFDRSPSMQDEAAVANLDAVYDGDMDDYEWVVADIDSTPERAVATCAKEIQECFYRVRAMHREARFVVCNRFLELLTDLAEGSAAVPPSVAGSISEKHCEWQLHCDALREEVDCIWSQANTRESKINNASSMFKAIAKELQKAQDAGTLYFHRVEENVTNLLKGHPGWVDWRCHPTCYCWSICTVGCSTKRGSCH